jgi:NAD(P)H-hydrate repair Nnr-like enzyme with NAD(P)H-hydrate epimerase domain
MIVFNACNKSCFKILCSGGNNTGDTMKYVSEKITNTKYKEETMVVSASNRNQLKQTISHNFDANVAFSEKKDDYKIILTDCFL